MSALPPKADMVQHDRDVRFVPEAEVAPIAGSSSFIGDGAPQKTETPRNALGVEVCRLKGLLY